MNRRPILLVRPDRGGDAIQTLPNLRVVRALRPEWQIHVLSSFQGASVFEPEPGITLHVLPTAWASMGSESLFRWVQTTFADARFAKVVSLPSSPRKEIHTLLEMLPAEERYSIGSVEEEGRRSIRAMSLPGNTAEGRREVENIAHLLSQSLGVEVARSVFQYSSAPILLESDLREAQEKMGPKLGEWLGFCPFSDSQRRHYPQRRWQRFVQMTTRGTRFKKFFLFGLPEDYQVMESLRNASPRKEDVEICFPSSFRSLGAYLSRLDGVVAVDSGPLNLARSFGVPSLGLLSGGDASRWFPPSREEDRVLPRGLFQRFPTMVEMWWAFRKWEPILPVPVSEQLSLSFH